MNRIDQQTTTGGLACHGRELREAINAVLDGLAAAQAIVETLRPTAPALDWVIGKVGADAVRALDAAARIERAGQAVGVQS